MIPSTDPNCFNNLEAVFGPMPGIPGILSAQEALTNAAISDLGPLNQKEINLIRQVYDKYSNDISILIKSNVKDAKLGNKK